MENGNKTEKRANLNWNHKTVFLKRENKVKEIKKGQNEVWIAKNGLMKNITQIKID